MNKAFVLITVLLKFSLIIYSTTMFAQTPTWNWIKNAGGNNSDSGSKVAVDSYGNVYVLGSFYSPTISFGSNTLTNLGNGDIFFVKYDAQGNVLWAKSVGSIYNDIGKSIAIDSNDNVFILGDFGNTLIFEYDTLIKTDAYWAVFIAKYDSQGNELWVKSPKGNKQEFSGGISVDVQGNVFITGYSDSDTLFFGDDTLINKGKFDVFLAKYDGQGNAVWAKNFGGTNSDCGASISNFKNEGIYITGYFSSPDLIFGVDTLSCKGVADIFLAKLDEQGNIIWTKGIGGASEERGMCVSTSSSGNVLIAGHFYGSFSFGTDTLINAGNEDIFLAKLDGQGNIFWARSAGGSSDDYASGIATDSFENIFITGYFSSQSLKFNNNITLNNTTLSAYNYYNDIFLAKYDAQGVVLWAKSAGGTKSDSGHGVSVGNDSKIYVVGGYGSLDALFDTYNLLFAGESDFFIASINSTVGFSELTNDDSEFIVYPNPATYEVFIEMSNLQLLKSNFKLFSIEGKLVKQGKLEEQKTRISTKDLESGVYFVEVNSSMDKVISKLIITR